MKKTAVTAAVLAMFVMTAPVAWAQDDDPTCDEAKTAVADLEKRLAAAAADESVKERDAVEAAKQAVKDARVARDAAQKAHDDGGTPTPDEVAALQAAKDALTARKAELVKAEAKLAADGPKVAGLRAQVELAIAARDKACAPATTTPAPQPDPAELDCGDFPLADGRTAQQVLDADQDDPHQLDEDGDLVACEADDPAANPPATPAPAPDVNVEVVVPQGGVATGGGPA